MDRRGFSRLVLAGCLGGPLAAVGQTSSRIPRIGCLLPGNDQATDDFHRREVLDPLRQFGWVEGKNFVAVVRFGNGPDMPRLAQELVALRVDLIVSGGTNATLAAKAATNTIPIVMDAASDPVGMGLVASLAHPGGNVTGYSLVTPDLIVKRAAILREIVPNLRRIAVVLGASPVFSFLRKDFKAAYQRLGIDEIEVETTSEQVLMDGIADAGRRGAQGLEFGVAGTPGWDERAIQVATQAHMPVLTASRQMIEAGALIYLSSDNADQHQRVAAIIDRILKKGAKPADIPVEQASRFPMIINLRAAQALRLIVPRSVILRADEVIR